MDLTAPTQCSLPGQFTVSTDVAVDDVHSKTWQRGTLPPSALAAAKASCSALSLGNLTNWRVPTVAEWQEVSVKCGLLNAGHPGTCAPCIDQEAFPPTPGSSGEGYWTADVLNSVNGQSFDSFSGRVFRVSVDTAVSVRCIHD